jgi:hypothetical protein
MAKKIDPESILTKPLPSTKVPWLVIWLLLASIVLIYLWGLRGADELLGPPLPKNEYEHLLVAPKKPTPRPAVTAPAGTPGPSQPTPAPATPPAADAAAPPPAAAQGQQPSPTPAPPAPVDAD